MGSENFLRPLTMREVFGFLFLSASAVMRGCAARPAFAPRKHFSIMKIRGGSVASYEQPSETIPASWVGKSPDYETPSQDTNSDGAVDANEFFDSPSLVDENPFQPPSVSVPGMAQALRWTSEMNRRLHTGTAEGIRQLVDPKYAQDSLQPQHQYMASNLDHLRGGGGGVVTAAAYRIPPTGPAESTATIFHAKTPRAGQRGAARWGPDLDRYLAQLVEIVASEGKTQQPRDPDLELSLALIYLDRASSMETPRAGGVPPCPFATPRTAHRLVLTAMMVAVSAFRGISDMTGLYAKIESAFGISVTDCHHMVDWMRAALGDDGISVTPEEMREWRLLWEARFAP